MGTIRVVRGRDVSKCAKVPATRETGGTKLLLTPPQLALKVTKGVHAFASGAPKLGVKARALSGKRRCETIDVKITKNTANMVVGKSGHSQIILIYNATDRISVRVE